MINKTIPQNGDTNKTGAVISVRISADELEAYIRIEPPQNGGSPPGFGELCSALEQAGLTQNIDRAKLRELSQTPLYNCDILIAAGQAPVNGTDGTATFLIETGKKQLRPTERADGTVDYHDLGLVENVRAGQVLCLLTPPSSGTPGVSVRGRVLHQQKGKAAPNYLGQNTYLRDDGTAILSRITGDVDFNGKKINVNETFYVRGDVDNSTGNIQAAGNLVVRGLVMPGFNVTAEGNIDIQGIVESASVKAGGNIKLHSGIIGSEVCCEGDLKSSYIENSSVFAKGDITSECVLNSTIICGKNLTIKGRMAKIIGGKYSAGQNIEAQTIGSAANTKTTLELTIDHSITERQQELQALIADLEKQIENLTPLITLMRQLKAANQLTADKVEVFKNVGASYKTTLESLEDAKKELRSLTDILYVKGYGRVICSGIIYPGTKVVIGTASYTVTEPLNNASLYLYEGNIYRGSAR